MLLLNGRTAEGFFRVYGFRVYGFRVSQTCNAAGPQAVTNREGDIILGTDVQDLVPVGVCKVLLVLQEAQLHHITVVSKLGINLGIKILLVLQETQLHHITEVSKLGSNLGSKVLLVLQEAQLHHIHRSEQIRQQIRVQIRQQIRQQTLMLYTALWKQSHDSGI